MSSQVPTHPSLGRPSVFAVVWHLCTWIGWTIVVLSVMRLAPSDLRAMGEPLAMIAAIVVFSELRPIVMTRLAGNPVSISLAFVFAVMYLWGPYPAVLLYAGSIVLSEILQRKPLWKLLFNVGQYICSLGAAWLVLVVAGVSASATSPHIDLSLRDVWWIVASWIVYHLMNLALVAALSEDEGISWWEDFTDEFWFYTVSTLAVLALSPLIAIVAVAYPYSWTMLPLLLLPLLAVQKAAEMSRHQEHLSLHDPLTGLPNRVLLNDRIEQALARSSRMRGFVVVFFLDLDLFKVVNDSLGHHAGDALLVDVAKRLSSAVRSGDTLARFGGDEFVVMCEDVSEDEVTTLATRITQALRQPFTSDDREVTVTASVGVAVADRSSTPHTLLRDADVAMYRAKERGRNKVVAFDAAMHQQANERLQDAVGLRRALEHDELRVAYQPILDLTTGRTIGMEALARWEDPDRGLVPPGLFIPAAEESGLITAIGQWVLDAALADASRWREDRGLDNVWVAVNISSRQLLSPTLVDEVESSLCAAGVPASALQLEITESAVMNDLEPVVDVLSGLRRLGVSLAVDDFGTGYSSLAYLKRLPVTTLKIDRAFIDGLGGADDAFDRPIVDAIIKMAQSLGLDVIAEGVETQEQLDALRALGGRFAQGFLWARPMAAEQAGLWLRSHSYLGRR
ncbi:MAG: EAL domain-containing protein [Actinobacteria bacterium]|nr:EAL domain-containing protein [Actinomycetota bacterium]MCB8996415.1 EAL domain-containing protein [Actinomycetota bacterium]MCB9425309.1 EAL domain-containing protein [Actinomycetota bacterium]